MNEKISFRWHTVAQSAIFVLGNAVIAMPTKNADEFTVIAFLLSLLLLCGIWFVMSFLSSFLLKIKTSDAVFKKIIGVTALISLAVFGLFCAAVTFTETVDFVAKVILPRSPKFFVAVLFGITVIYFAFKRQENVLKFSLVSFALIAIVILFFFIAAADKYDLRNIFIFRLPTFKEIGTQIKPYIINPVLPVLLLPVYYIFTFGEKCTRTGFCGILVGTVLLALCILMPVLLFGTALAGRLEFPFSSAVSTVTVGRLFTRLDVFSYFVYFACSLIKITVCLFVTFASLKKINAIVKSTE